MILFSPMDYAECFTRIREERGWTQENLALWLGISQSAVSKIETGQMPPNAEVLIRIYLLDKPLFRALVRSHSRHMTKSTQL